MLRPIKYQLGTLNVRLKDTMREDPKKIRQHKRIIRLCFIFGVSILVVMPIVVLIGEGKWTFTKVWDPYGSWSKSNMTTLTSDIKRTIPEKEHLQQVNAIVNRLNSDAGTIRWFADMHYGLQMTMASLATLLCLLSWRFRRHLRHCVDDKVENNTEPVSGGDSLPRADAGLESPQK